MHIKEFFLNGPQDYKLMSQVGVKQYCYPLDCTHNAIWDCNLSPDGRFYFSLASELSTCGYTRLCEYDYEKNDVTMHFAAEDVILPSERTIRASKFHSSINFLPDGRLIMTTHTTDKAPEHPTWMPHAYYNHIWEGYAGSNIIIYDPARNKAENIGIPVQRETIYGAVYEPRHNALFFIGCFRGHLYRYSLDDKRVLDLGKVSECYSFRLVLGPDGHIYGASATGYMYKVDTDTLKIHDLNYKLPHNIGKFVRAYNNLSTGHIGPDGRLYLSVMYGDEIVALDTESGKFESMGKYIPAKSYVYDENRNVIFGKDFDSKGILWYAVTGLNDGGPENKYGLPTSLFCWDIANGKRPEWAGILGTKNRVAGCISGLCISDDDILYAVNTNHSTDGPDITAIDLKLFRPHMHEIGGTTDDQYFNPEAPYYIQITKKMNELDEISKNNPYNFNCKMDFSPIRLWRALAPDNVENSGVIGIAWDDEGNLHGMCGKEKKFVFKIVEGKLESIVPVTEAETDYVKWVSENMEPKISTFKLEVKLPAYPGRQYKAVSHIDVEFSGNRRIVGTEDGMLAIVSDKGVFSLGPAAPNGPVHAMSTNPQKTILYGVAGDREDLGSVFTYDDANGLLWEGTIYHNSSDHIGVVCCNQLSCCSISKDGRYLAIASNDRLGCVLIYSL